MWHRIRMRAALLLRADEEERALREEVRFHLEMDARRQELLGHPAERARRLAEHRFGDVERVLQEARDARRTPTLEGAVHDVGSALRALVRARGFSAVAVLTLALGVAATTVAFTLVNGILLTPLPYAAADRLVLIEEVTEAGATATPWTREGAARLAPSYPNFVDWRERARSFDGMVSSRFPAGTTVRLAGGAERVQSVGVSRGFFHTLGVQPLYGREFTEEENRPGGPGVVLVAYEFWRDRLGAETRLSEIRLTTARGPAEVVGVLPPGFTFMGTAELYVPHEQEPVADRTGHNYRVVGRLRPGETLAAARGEMTTLSRSLKTTFGEGTQAADAAVTPLRDVVVGSHARLLGMLLGASALVLLIACVNLVSAQLARGAGRGRELAIRAALGAGRGRLVRLLCTEAGVLAVVGAGAGVALALALLAGIRALGAGMLPRIDEVRVDIVVLAFTSLVATFAGVVTGLLPALRASRAGSAALRTHGAGGGPGARSHAWSLLIGCETALAVLLLIGAVLLMRTLDNILSLDTGFDARGLITVAVSQEQADAERLLRIEREIAAVTGTLAAGTANRLPLLWGNVAGPVLRPTDVPPAWPAYAGFRMVSPGYFDALGMPVVEGRTFTAEDRADGLSVAIVSRPLAERLWPGESAIGQRVRTNYLSELWLTVVGVVPEARDWAEEAGAQHEIYTPIAQHPARAGGTMYFVARTDAAAEAVVPALRARLREVAPDLPFAFGTMEDRIATGARDRRFAAIVLGAFAIVALFLAGVGIYGVVAHTVALRTREIGIRMALGATAAGVLRTVLGGTVGAAVIGVGAGAVAGAAGTRALESLLFGVDRLDVRSFAIGTVVLLAVAVLAAWLPARRTSRVDPLIVIRAE